MSIALPTFSRLSRRRLAAQEAASRKELRVAVRVFFTIGPRTAHYISRRRWLRNVHYRADNRYARRLGLLDTLMKGAPHEALDLGFASQGAPR